jgi:hypothetical protein
MEQNQWDKLDATIPPSIGTARLIRKLRWIGIVEETSRLQRVSGVSNLRRQGILAEIPYGTD